METQLLEPSPTEFSNASSDSDDTGSQDPPAEIKANPKVHTEVLAPKSKHYRDQSSQHSQSARSTNAPPHMQNCIVAVSLAHQAVGMIYSGYDLQYKLVPVHHYQNVDVHTSSLW